MHKLRVLFGVVFTLLFLASCKDNSLPTLLVLGQSNITGWGDVDKIPQEELEKFENSKDNVYYIGFGHNKFREYEHVHRTGGDKYLKTFMMEGRSTFTPVFSLYPLMSELYQDHDALIFHYAIASLSSYSSWHPDWSEERMALFPNHRNKEHKQDQFAKFLKHLDTTRNLAKENGFNDLDIKAVVWFGGETDALNNTAATAYYESMSDIITAVRAELDDPELPFILQQVNCVNFPLNEVIRGHQEKLAQTISNVHLITTQNQRSPSDYGKYSDELHYNADGILNLGREAGYKVIDCVLNR